MNNRGLGVSRVYRPVVQGYPALYRPQRQWWGGPTMPETYPHHLAPGTFRRFDPRTIKQSHNTTRRTRGKWRKQSGCACG